jgi:hypothetical protein
MVSQVAISKTHGGAAAPYSPSPRDRHIDWRWHRLRVAKVEVAAPWRYDMAMTLWAMQYDDGTVGDAIWQYGDTAMWQFGDTAIWQYGDTALWHSEAAKMVIRLQAGTPLHSLMPRETDDSGSMMVLSLFAL